MENRPCQLSPGPYHVLMKVWVCALRRCELRGAVQEIKKWQGQVVQPRPAFWSFFLCSMKLPTSERLLSNCFSNLHFARPWWTKPPLARLHGFSGWRVPMTGGPPFSQQPGGQKQAGAMLPSPQPSSLLSAWTCEAPVTDGCNIMPYLLPFPVTCALYSFLQTTTERRQLSIPLPVPPCKGTHALAHMHKPHD